MHTLKRNLLACVAVVALAAVQPHRAEAWSAPLNLSSDADATEWSDVAVAADGTVHAVWTDQSTREMKYSMRPPGGSWTAPVVVGTYAGSTLFSDGDIAIAVAPDGTVHIIYADDSSGNSEIYHRAKPPGGAWTAAVNISQTPGTRSEFPDLAVTPNGAVHAAWIDVTPTNGFCCSDTYYATKPLGGSWSAAIDVSNNGANEYEIRVGVGPDNSVHIITAQEDGGPGQQNIYYYEKPPGGSFAPAVNLTNNPNMGRNMGGVLKTADGTVHVVYYENFPSEVIYRSRAACGTWSGPLDLSNNASSSGNPDIGADACGTIHVVWVDDAAGGQVQYSARPFNGLWSTPLDITGGAPGARRVRLALRGAHDSNTGTAEVVYTAAPGGVTDAFFTEADLSGCGVAQTTAVLDPVEAPAGTTANVIRVEPNPALDRVRLAMPAAGAPSAVKIFDAAGRRVRTLELSSRAREGWREAEWDGHDDVGARVAAGIYWARAAWAGREAASRVVLVH